MRNGWIALIMILMVGSLKSQNTAIGLWGGGINYIGDLTDQTIVWNETQAAVGGLLTYQPNPFFNLRIGLSVGTIGGTDANRANTDTLRVRNLSFESQLMEFAVMGELNLIGYDVQMEPFSPYLFFGVAGIYHNPRAFYQGAWYDLQPLGTEGQGTTEFPDRKPYSRMQVAFPVGLGMKFALGSGLTLAAEAGFRYTLTDYLDDVSLTYADPNIQILENGDLSYRLSNRTGEYLGTQNIDYVSGTGRGNPDNTDWYVMGGVSLTYTLGVPIGTSRGKSGCGWEF